MDTVLVSFRQFPSFSRWTLDEVCKTVFLTLLVTGSVVVFSAWLFIPEYRSMHVSCGEPELFYFVSAKLGPFCALWGAFVTALFMRRLLQNARRSGMDTDSNRLTDKQDVVRELSSLLFLRSRPVITLSLFIAVSSATYALVLLLQTVGSATSSLHIWVVPFAASLTIVLCLPLFLVLEHVALSVFEVGSARAFSSAAVFLLLQLVFSLVFGIFVFGAVPPHSPILQGLACCFYPIGIGTLGALRHKATGLPHVHTESLVINAAASMFAAFPYRLLFPSLSTAASVVALLLVETGFKVIIHILPHVYFLNHAWYGIRRSMRWLIRAVCFLSFDDSTSTAISKHNRPQEYIPDAPSPTVLAPAAPDSSLGTVQRNERSAAANDPVQHTSSTLMNAFHTGFNSVEFPNSIYVEHFAERFALHMLFDSASAVLALSLFLLAFIFSPSRSPSSVVFFPPVNAMDSASFELLLVYCVVQIALELVVMLSFPPLVRYLLKIYFEKALYAADIQLNNYFVGILYESHSSLPLDCRDCASCAQFLTLCLRTGLCTVRVTYCSAEPVAPQSVPPMLVLGKHPVLRVTVNDAACPFVLRGDSSALDLLDLDDDLALQLFGLHFAHPGVGKLQLYFTGLDPRLRVFGPSVPWSQDAPNVQHHDSAFHDKNSTTTTPPVGSVTEWPTACRIIWDTQGNGIVCSTGESSIVPPVLNHAVGVPSSDALTSIGRESVPWNNPVAAYQPLKLAAKAILAVPLFFIIVFLLPPITAIAAMSSAGIPCEVTATPS